MKLISSGGFYFGGASVLASRKRQNRENRPVKNFLLPFRAGVNIQMKQLNHETHEMTRKQDTGIANWKGDFRCFFVCFVYFVIHP
jgi:hypothetical protein